MTVIAYVHRQHSDARFFDKDAQFWRTKRDGSLVSNRPAQIQNFWMGLPPQTNKIDAVYERKSDSHIIFFIGKWQNSKVMLAWTGMDLKSSKVKILNKKSIPGAGNLAKKMRCPEELWSHNSA